MIKEISALEKAATLLEPNESSRKELIDAAWTYTNEFVKNIKTIKAYDNDQTGLAQLDKWDLNQPKSIEDLLSILKESVDKVGINPASGGHLGYIPGGGIYTSAIGDYLAAVLNRYAGLYFGSPGAIKLENKIIKWACEIMGYPKGALGNITSGGSIANLITITTARDKKKITGDRIEQSVIYYTEQTHHCVNKAVRIAGLSSCPTRQIKVDTHFRMDPVELVLQVQKDIEDGLTPFYIAASCGSTDTGAVDPFDRIADIAEEHNIWFHVDGAYGGFFILDPDLKELFKGINRADSIVLDPHKSLFMPYGCGLVLLKDGQALFESYHYMANYLQDAYTGMEEVSPADLSPELTKHFRGLRIWLPLQLHGIAPFIAALKEKRLLTLYLHQELQQLGFEVGPKPDLSVCIYRYIPNQGDANSYNETLVKQIQEDGRIFVSSTNINGVYWIRAAIVSFRTHLDTIDLYLSILKKLISKH